MPRSPESRTAIKLASEPIAMPNPPTLTPNANARQSFENSASMIAAGTLKLRIEHTYSLAEAQRAQRDLEGRKTTGKLLLIP